MHFHKSIFLAILSAITISCSDEKNKDKSPPQSIDGKEKCLSDEQITNKWQEIEEVNRIEREEKLLSKGVQKAEVVDNIVFDEENSIEIGNVVLKNSSTNEILSSSEKLAVGKTYEIVEVSTEYQVKNKTYRALKAYKYVSVIFEQEECRSDKACANPELSVGYDPDSRGFLKLAIKNNIEKVNIVACKYQSAKAEVTAVAQRPAGQFLLFSDELNELRESVQIEIKVKRIQRLPKV